MAAAVTGSRAVVVTVDVEDWLQSTWDRSQEITDRAADNTLSLLDVLAEHGTNCSMFVLGKFARRFPAIVQRIDREGHEVGSHGYGHVPISQQSRDSFRADVVRSKRLLEDTIGKPVAGFRAPDFSITDSTLWALEILAQEGFEYDSSIYPIKSARYGIANWPPEPVRVRLPSQRSIVELPMATLRLLSRNWPVAGGGYHRLMPWALIRYAVIATLRSGKPFVAYFHPYELDQDELGSLRTRVPRAVRFHQGFGRSSMKRKLELLLSRFRTCAARDISMNNWRSFTP